MTHQWAQPASQLGDDRGLSEDRSPAPLKKETALAKTGLCLFRGWNRFV